MIEDGDVMTEVLREALALMAVRSGDFSILTGQDNAEWKESAVRSAVLSYNSRMRLGILKLKR